jgi:hypothetical protein
VLVLGQDRPTAPDETTRAKNHAAMLFGATKPPPREPRAGERQWTIRTRDGAMLTCEIREHDDADAEIQLWRDGELLCGQRMPGRRAATHEAACWRTIYLDAGGASVPDHWDASATRR